MIRRLRIRFILIMMSIMTLFVIGITGGVFVLMRNSEEVQSIELMEKVLDLGDLRLETASATRVGATAIKNAYSSILIADSVKIYAEENAPIDTLTSPDDSTLQAMETTEVESDYKSDRKYLSPPAVTTANPDDYYYWTPPAYEYPWMYHEDNPPPDEHPPDKPDESQWLPPPWWETTSSATTTTVSTVTTVTTPSTSTEPSHTTVATLPTTSEIIATTTLPTVAAVTTTTSLTILTEPAVSLTVKKTEPVPPPDEPHDTPPAETPPKDHHNEITENDMFRNCILVNMDGNSVLDVKSQIIDTIDSNSLSMACSLVLDSSRLNGIIEIDGVEYRFMQKNYTGQSASDIVFLDRTLEKNTLNNLLAILIAIGFGGIAVMFLISLFLARWATEPIRAAWEKQKQFVADASHEMKTPLTVIDANMDVVLSSPEATVEQQKKWLDYIKSETGRMNKLVHSLLYIAKYDANEQKPICESFDLSEAVIGVCLVFETHIYELGKTIQSDITPDLQYYGDIDKIRQLVTILIDNAIKHSDDHGQIYVTLAPDTTKKSKIRLIVANTGDPIPDDSQQKIFERFYRVDKSRARQTGGSGLGLSIAKTIVEEHNGKISVSSGDGELTRFVVII